METNERTEITKKNLMIAFLTLYKEKKIEQITIKNITDLAGYNRGTFYVYYKDVYDVLEQAESLMLQRFSQAFEQLIILKKDFFPEAFFKTIMGVFLENQQLASVLMSRGTIEFHNSLKNMAKGKAMQLDKNLTPEDRKKLELTIEYQASAVIGIVSYWMNSGSEESAEDIIAFVVDVTQNGVIRILSRYMR